MGCFKLKGRTSAGDYDLLFQITISVAILYHSGIGIPLSEKNTTLKRKPALLTCNTVSIGARPDQEFINVSISSGSIGMSAIRFFGLPLVIRMSFSRRIPICSSGIYKPGSQVMTMPALSGA